MTSYPLKLQHHVATQISPTPRVLDIAVMFGLSIDGTDRQTIIPPIDLALEPGKVVFVTGVSGGGKSTLLRLIAEALLQDMDQAQAPGVVRLDRLPALPDAALVDALARPEAGRADDTPDMPDTPDADLQTVCRWLSLAGLNDAAVMLRRPIALSEGQRHRLRLAQAMGVAERQRAAWSVLLADEYCSCLDRTTAYALAHSTRRWITRSNVCLIAATAHDDLLEPLAPDTLVQVMPAGQCSVYQRPA